MFGLSNQGHEAFRLVEQQFDAAFQALGPLIVRHPKYLAVLVDEVIEKALEIRSYLKSHHEKVGNENSRQLIADDNIVRDRQHQNHRTGTPNVEDLLIDFLTDEPRGLTIEDLAEMLDQFGYEIQRTTLIVRLRRMAAAGKIKNKSRGQYVLANRDEA